MTTQRELELEAEVMRLREALENHSGNYKLTKDECRKMDALLSTPFTPTALNDLIEKVEKRTIERCARESERSHSKEQSAYLIRALPIGQIKLGEVL